MTDDGAGDDGTPASDPPRAADAGGTGGDTPDDDRFGGAGASATVDLSVDDGTPDPADDDPGEGDAEADAATRRRLLKYGGTGGVLALGGGTALFASRSTGSTEVTSATGRGSEAAPFDGGTLELLLSPTAPGGRLQGRYKPVVEHLQAAVDGVDAVSLAYAENHGDVLAALGNGRVDVAETGPFAAALGLESGALDVLVQRHAYGSWTYASVLLTREDSDVETLADLRGERVALADPTSSSGSLYPLYMLQRAGLEIPDELGSAAGADFEPTWSGHTEALEAVTNGQATAAGVGRFVAVDPDTGTYREGVRELAAEEGIPRAPLAVSPELGDDEVAALRRALVEADDDVFQGADGEPTTDDDLWYDDVRPVEAATYRPLAAVADALDFDEAILGR